MDLAAVCSWRVRWGWWVLLRPRLAPLLWEEGFVMLGGWGLLGWDLPCDQQCGRAALPVPGLPLLCAVLLGDTLRMGKRSLSPGGTAMLRQEMPLQMENKTTWRDGRCFPREERCGCIVLKCIILEGRPSFPLPCPFLILAFPRRACAGKTLPNIAKPTLHIAGGEGKLEVFTSPKIMGCKVFGGLPQASVCGSVTQCSHCLRKAVSCLLLGTSLGARVTPVTRDGLC